MSLTQTVFIARSKAPTAKAWARAIRARGFPFAMYDDFDLETHSGFLPCHLDQRRDGFEYFWSAIDDGELDARVKRKIKAFDTAITFKTGSSQLGYDFAVAAAGVLTELTDGMYLNDESGDFFHAPEIMKLAFETDWSPPVSTPAPNVVVPKHVAANIEARVVFWGDQLIMFETGEPKMRCTIRMSTKSLRKVERLTVCSMWETPHFENTVHGVIIGETTVWLDSIGALITGA